MSAWRIVRSLVQRIGHRSRSLRVFIMTALTLAVLIMFVVAMLLASAVYDRVLRQQAAATAEAVSHQTFNSMYAIMRLGWNREQLVEFMDTLEQAYATSPLSITLFRGDPVVAQYGAVTEYDRDTVIQRVLNTGEIQRLENQAGLRYSFPLVARQDCLGCHSRSEPGSVLGVMDVHYHLGAARDQAAAQLISLFWIGIPLVLLVAMLAGWWGTRRLHSSLLRFRAQIQQVNSVQDVHNIQAEHFDLGFIELNQVMREVNHLTGRLKDIAVDKDILEFELRLLDKFIITSDVVKDWREYIAVLLREINTIIPASTLFTLFKETDDSYDLEIFWYQQPSDRTQRLFEKIAALRIRSQEDFGPATELSIRHHVAMPDQAMPELNTRDLELASRDLLLETPRIGGVVGIGVHSDLMRDPIRHVVIESVLATLLNLVGSVKAIYKYTQDLEYYATRDPLTQLYNHRVFWDLLEYEVHRAQRHQATFAVLVIDLDNFKTINDHYGHAFGDQFLTQFANAIHASLRAGDVLARYGGDEFSIILPEVDEQGACAAAQRILAALDAVALDAPDGTPVRGSGSIGVALYPQHAEDPKDLFLIADNMMYKAKRSGKHSIASPAEGEVAEVFREVGEQSRMVLQALEDRRVIPFFQPIVSTASGECAIHELLMRIVDAQGNVIPAGVFVESAERMGMMHKLDHILIEKAFAQIRQQDYRGLLFINLSPKALVMGDFLQKLRHLSAEYAIPYQRIVLEITERETVRNIALLEKFVLEMKQDGFKFAIDDFGSGFSSFHYLKRFPIDYLKIEGDFVRNMTRDHRDRAFVLSIAALAQALKVTTVAEFVEDEEILQAVKDTGIDFAQGYHLGRPDERFRSGSD